MPMIPPNMQIINKANLKIFTVNEVIRSKDPLGTHVRHLPDHLRGFYIDQNLNTYSIEMHSLLGMVG